MVIVSAADDERFAAHFAAMLHSAWMHNPTAEFYLLDCGIDPQSLADLRAFAISRGIQLTFINIDVTLFRDFPTTEALSAASAARLLIPDLFPSSIERVLYLDADCIVVADLTALWRFDLGEAAIAAVHDPDAWIERELGLNLDEEGYINAGVMLMNLAVWRRDNLGAAAMAFAIKHKLHVPDQTALNVVCSGKIVHLSEEWNFQLDKLRRPQQWIEPSIIHFSGPWKPSMYSDVPPFSSIYLYHRNQTPFAIKRLRPYRAPLRRLINLLIGRRKYWNQFIIARRSQAFATAYFDKLARLRVPQSCGQRLLQRWRSLLAIGSGPQVDGG